MKTFPFKKPSPRRIRFALCAIIFLIAFGVRVLTWQDTRLEVRKVQTVVAENYKTVAQLFREEGVRGFFSSSSSLADLNHLGHPPGYSVLLSMIRSGPGESDAPVQFFQIFVDALSAVLIFLIVAELLSVAPAIIAGLLAAFSPQLAWNSVLLLPDSLSVFPILLAVYLLAVSRKHPRLLIFVSIGALVGISCWLRANAMVLTIFLALAAALVCSTALAPKRIGGDKHTSIGHQWRYGLAVVIGTLLILLPLTIRNAIVFHRFIPISLGGGQTLLEGIADYDDEGRFNISPTDMGIMQQEAEAFQRPDYNRGLLEPDGIQRERWRFQSGVKVIGAHPVWFGGVMIRRAGSMVKLERARLISINPAVTYPLHLVDQSSIVWTMTAANLPATSTAGAAKIKTSLSPDGRIFIIGDDSSYGTQFVFPPAKVQADREYVFKVSIRIAQGRMKIAAIDGSGSVHSKAILEVAEGAPPAQPFKVIDLPFTTSRDGEIRLALSNEASNQPPNVEIASANLYNLRPAQHSWTRYPRLLIHGIQKLIITAVILPLAIIGLAFLVIRKRRNVLIILSVVPLYYFCFQSIFHTEYRYVLAINHFLFAFAAVAVTSIVGWFMGKMSAWRRAPAQSID
jgi:hypothetical protein